jgi:hypothetical protein
MNSSLKTIHSSSLFLGLFLGLLAASTAPYIHKAFADDTNTVHEITFKGAPTTPSIVPASTDTKKEVMSQEELDKKLDAVIESQKDLKARVETILTQSRFLKASSGK